MTDPHSTPSESILSSISELRQQLLCHPIYSRIDSLPSLRIFMQHHGFAVLDFMWLLKRLQQELCSVMVPWLPARNPERSRFINEIVLAEESDEDGEGKFASHFELYLRAMQDVESDRGRLDSFVDLLRGGCDVSTALNQRAPADTVREFVEFTFQIASKGLPAEVASAFCFGREDIIPDMFDRLQKTLFQSGMTAPRFAYYIRRHIELDGDHHGPFSLRLVDSMCNTPEATDAAIRAARRAIELRIRLWDGVVRQLDDQAATA